MASTSERQKLCDEIIKGVKEYSTEDNIACLEEAKAEIVQLLVTYRPVKLGDFEYGLSHALKKDCRLIIKEENDKSKAREYGKTRENWYCSNVTVKRIKCNAPQLKFKYGILFAPKNHKCKPKDYSLVMKVQYFLKQGNTLEAQRLVQGINKVNRCRAKSMNSSLSQSNSSAGDASDMENESMVEESVLTQSEQSSSEAETADVETSVNSNGASEPETNNYSLILDEPAVKKPKIEPNNNNTFPFNRPSDAILRKKCQKLKIDYNNEAYKLWGDIAFDKILQFSSNIETHEYKSQNLFECISMFFTGQITKSSSIQDTISAAFCEELTKTGTKSPSEVAQACTVTTVSNEHLEFIAKFLACRIGIYENGKLKKYGKWESENHALALILGFVDGFYSVVLDL